MNQTMVTKVCVTQEWRDEVLLWNPKKYGNIETTTLPSSRVWTPDLYLFNNADVGHKGYVNVNDSKILVRYDGHVTWRLPLMLKSLCAVDVKFFPFDRQHCAVRLGSWIYDVEQVDLQLKHPEVDMSQYETNAEFDLIHLTLERELATYELIKTVQPQVVMTVDIQRRPLYYLYTIIAPTLVLCFLTLFSFMLPCDSGEKVAIDLTAFLSLYVLQSSVAENIPESDKVPLIGLFLTLVMTLISISLLFATLVINIKKRGDHHPSTDVPLFLINLCRNYLARVTCTQLLTSRELYDNCAMDTQDGHVTGNNAQESRETYRDNDELVENHRGETTRDRERRHHLMSRYYERDRRESNRRGLSGDRDPKLEWFFVAQVVDKLLLYVFFVAMTVTVTTTLLIVPWMNWAK
ncbi:hypothetical protein NP493_510g02027 [Ridgeia piscesae]|uniref:Uncharacterized protein n=1 Tax=Ridgeia piscesae TaxID=27915 RepID=A0AAD9KXG1_RIDPI|nr:hypothetical protein NP493_510g02027 [Ridgeia piscesae]